MSSVSKYVMQQTKRTKKKYKTNMIHSELCKILNFDQSNKLIMHKL